MMFINLNTSTLQALLSMHVGLFLIQPPENTRKFILLHVFHIKQQLFLKKT